MITELQLAVLGRPQAGRDGVPVSGFVSAKALALLCYLAVTGQPHTRETRPNAGPARTGRAVFAAEPENLPKAK